MSEARLADTPGTVATFTVDRLAFSPSPPLVDAVVTPTELVLMEDKGFSDRGQAWKDILAGDFELAGRLPVNPDGGLKSFGHPVGASGLRMLYEAWLQLRHEAGQRQIEGPRLALTHNLGGRPGSCVSFVSIVGGEQGVRGGKR
jgi:acetyl-CoA C-acetyltransferase